MTTSPQAARLAKQLEAQQAAEALTPEEREALDGGVTGRLVNTATGLVTAVVMGAKPDLSEPGVHLDTASTAGPGEAA